jgi:carboxymethylenebutenolidase
MTNGRKMQLASKADCFILTACHTTPEDARQGGLVLVQEIFGVTEHIRRG